ncbi:MAG: type II toxin-antitoxin system RelE/ParE family toxin [Acidobacteriota bacterium]|nr:type II toxin-antitoxin system RelE/ParE family toxin [Acidobacteriota bacterium]
MIRIEWASRAFLVLETLPQAIAFEIIHRVDLLPKFPEMGAKIDSRFQSLKGYRQIIVKSRYRVIYDFDEIENRIYILAVQNCRQEFPSTRDLKRKASDDE